MKLGGGGGEMMMENIHNAAKQGFVQSKLSSPPPPPKSVLDYMYYVQGNKGILYCGVGISIAFATRWKGF